LADQEIINWMQYQSAAFHKFIQFTKFYRKLLLITRSVVQKILSYVSPK